MSTPIITLTTDFGTSDGYVAAMKGKIYASLPDVQIVDISHDIPAQDVFRAGFCLKRALTHFPEYSIHIVVVDPGVGSNRNTLLLKLSGQWILCPENDLLAPLLDGCQPTEAYILDDNTRWWDKHNSFDGLHLFTPAAVCLAKNCDPKAMGRQYNSFNPPTLPVVSQADDRLTGEIITFDHFGNAITNISLTLCQTHRLIVFEFDTLRFTLKSHYSEVNEGELLAILNSDGLIELSIYKGSAKKRFHLEIGDRVIGH